jgi:hypothetical protein
MQEKRNQYNFKQLPDKVKPIVSLSTKSKKRYSPSEKRFALGLYYKSPSCYKYLRSHEKLPFPSISTLRYWLRNFQVKTGLDNHIHN